MNPASAGRSPARDALVFWAIAGLFAIGSVILLLAHQMLLLGFAGVLFGTSLRALAARISSWLGWRLRWSLLACVVLLLLLAVGAGLWVVPAMAHQASALADRVSEAYQRLRQDTGEIPFLNWSDAASRRLGSYAVRAAGILASTAGAIGGFVFVAFVSLYVAGDPGPYRRGLLRLLPPARRERGGQVLETLGANLRRWLLARLVSMTAVGLATALGLWPTDIPLPFTLALIAGLLGFVPNIGPLVSAVPAVLLAFTVSPMHALYVVLLYLAVNLADGYGLTPWLQRRALAVPPAFLLLGQVVIGALFGVLGVMLATPLLACLLVLIRELYVRDLEAPPQAQAGVAAAAGP